ncbi:MAG: glutamate racemase [Acidobacteria bacterium]|nr:glutamate racemase [Acidobacteriota bacterium]
MLNSSIGIFDSGVGGLTVYRAIRERLPEEKIIYLGDTARIPYGTRSAATVRRYAYQDASFLYKQNVKLLVIACNTISSVALDLLTENFPVPILGVIEPGAKKAIQTTKNGRIGVIATEATVESNAYVKAIKTLNSSVEVYTQACPLFVALAEEGWHNHKATKLIAIEYLSYLQSQEIDTLVLGCTHYPLLKEVIQSVVGSKVTLIDSGACVAEEVEGLIKSSDTVTSNKNTCLDSFYVTDSGKRFSRIAELFLGQPIENLIAVDIWDENAKFKSNIDINLSKLSLNNL